MKFINISLFVATVACSSPFSVRGGGGSSPKIFVSAAEEANRHHDHHHAYAIAAIAGNTAVESFHEDLFLAYRVINQQKEARARSLRVLAAEDDGADGMSQSELKDALKKCEAERLAPSNLYVQTAGTCRLRRRDDDTYTLKSTDLSGTTWLFTDRPFKIESSVDTASFVADFDETFPGQPPNFALTAVLPSGKFDEPLVALMEKAYMADDGEIVKYRIRQSKSQAGNGISLADVVGEVGEGVDLEYCSFFIDSVDSSDCNTCMCQQPCSRSSDCMVDSYCTWCTSSLNGKKMCVPPT